MYFHLHLLLETTINKRIQDEGKAFHYIVTYKICTANMLLGYLFLLLANQIMLIAKTEGIRKEFPLHLVSAYSWET